jgi:hypothetical protein
VWVSSSIRFQRFADPSGFWVIGPSMNSKHAQTTACGSRCKFRRAVAAKMIRYGSGGTGGPAELGPQLLQRHGATGRDVRLGLSDLLQRARGGQDVQRFQQ